MALTPLQRAICGLLAENRIASGESYVAGGVALNELIEAARISRDIDLFHDTDEALAASWHADRRLLEANGYEVVVVRERATVGEAEVSGRGIPSAWSGPATAPFASSRSSATKSSD